MDLLAREYLLPTGPVDHADWNYKPIIGAIQRLRFSLILKLIGDRRFGSVLEIGYGSGVFMPELKRRAHRLTGIDIHGRNVEVCAMLGKSGVAAELHSASVTSIPFPDATFDCAVAVSAMEFVDDADQACREIRRVLKPGGEFLLVTPGSSPLLDLGLWALTRQSAKKDFAGGRERVIPAVQKYFDTGSEIRSPRVGHQLLCLYRAMRMIRS